MFTKFGDFAKFVQKLAMEFKAHLSKAQQNRTASLKRPLASVRVGDRDWPDAHQLPAARVARTISALALSCLPAGGGGFPNSPISCPQPAREHGPQWQSIPALGAGHPARPQITICVPTSITRSVGMRKCCEASLEWPASQMKSLSCHTGIFDRAAGRKARRDR